MLMSDSQLIPACGVHQTALILIATPPNSQLIPACGVHPGSTFCRQLILDSQLIPACGVHRRSRRGIPRLLTLNSYPRAVCIFARIAAHLWLGNSQLIPACGVHPDPKNFSRYLIHSQLIPACGVHPASAESADDGRTLNSYPRAVCIITALQEGLVDFDSQLIPACGVHRQKPLK